MAETLICLAVLLVFFLFNQSIDHLFAEIFKENDLHLLIQTDSDEFMYQRIRKAKPVILLLVAWPSLKYNLLFFIFVISLFILMIKAPYLNLKRNLKKQANQLKFQFPIWLRQLQILIQTNTVVKSLELSLSTAPELIIDDLKLLIEQIEADALNLQPYLNFLKSYRLSEIERAMKLLYRYNTIGKEDAYTQFNRMIQTTTKWLRAERSARYDSKLMLFQWWGMLPLFGVTLLFMAIMFEIIITLFGKGVTL